MKKKTLNRRSFVRYGLEMGAMVGLVGGLSVLPSKGNAIRPPRAVAPEEFTALCMRCGVCVEVCPSHALRLKDLTLDIKNISTPVLDPDFGGCLAWKDNCDECAQACPTHAIDPLRSLAGEKLGFVTLEKDRCVNCMVCLMRCPVEGAVLFPNPKGKPFTREKDIPTVLKLRTSPLKPYIDVKKCVGCGLCVYHCPEKIMHLHKEKN
ncbi:4Fe-4S dicluster domain-containing protein [Desulfobaculum bizertense]|nr:4Fe-4S dicluster domain-containing protein [Desulfobaculum bizertense]UIJ37005.1 4Fe-4S dicluster domain-containing protein [Desulfobaculum bizertense]